MTTKMNNIKIIEFFPLQKIEVVESEKAAYKPGSLGYIVSIGPSNSFIKAMTATFMRFGQKGKKRVTTETLFYQSLDISDLKEKDIKTLTDVGVLSYRNATAKLTPAIQETKNLEDMPGYEFVCYIAAFSYYLYYLDIVGNLRNRLRFNAQCYPYRYSVLDTLQFIDTLDQFGDGIVPTTLHNIITSASVIGKIDGRDLLKYIVTFYETPANRRVCMEVLYKSLSTYKKAVEISQTNMIDNNLKTLETIKGVLCRSHKDKKQAGKPKKAQKKDNKTKINWERVKIA